jgi:hypothetical protein
LYIKLYNTQNRPFALAFNAEGKGTLKVRAFVKNRPSTVLINRDINIDGNEHVYMPMPITGKVTVVHIDAPKWVKFSDPVPVKLKTGGVSSYNSPEDAEFRRFAKEVAYHAGLAKQGVIKSNVMPDKFEVKFSNVIKEPNGGKSNTPARTFKPLGEIEINRPMFAKMTVPMRLFILLHERAHIRANTADEALCDRIALEQYLAMGFPESEAMYAFTDVMKPVSANHENHLLTRMNYMLGNIRRMGR